MIACSILDYGNSKERLIILKEVEERFQYIYESAFDLIDLNEEYFDKDDVSFYFPPRYLREHSNKDIISVIYDIKEILYSNIVRWELKPIYTYVIYNMIESCFELVNELYDKKECIGHLLPKSIKNMLKNSKMSKEEKEIVYDWFTKSYLLSDDFCDTYDGDLTDLHMMETLAYHYIYQPQVYEMMGADIEGALDLISKDLAELFVETKKSRTINNATEFDFFISYASEEKDVAVLLTTKLEELGTSVWIDDKQLKIGDQIRTSLEKGLINSRYGIVLISKNYLDKYWTNQELNSLYELEEHGIKKILPIMIDVSHDEIKKKSLFLANKLSLQYDREKLHEIANKIITDCRLGKSCG